MTETLSLSDRESQFLKPYLPSKTLDTKLTRPLVTLTFAIFLDSSIAIAPGVRTQLSGPKSKVMTHYLRSRHDAILIGVGTAVADDPGLNCRLDGVGADEQPRPIIVDPDARCQMIEDSRLIALAKEKRGKAPYILTSNPSPSAKTKTLLEKYGGKYIYLDVKQGNQRTFEWRSILERLSQEALGSIMIEGGASVINSLLEPKNHEFIDAVIVTIAPRWIGQGGVTVSPGRRTDEGGAALPTAILQRVQWHQLGKDVVLLGSMADLHPKLNA